MSSPTSCSTPQSPPVGVLCEAVGTQERDPRGEFRLYRPKEMNMKNILSLASAITLLAAIVVLSPAPALAQGGHYVVTNNDPSSVANSATIFKLEGMSLDAVKVLQTGGNG